MFFSDVVWEKYQILSTLFWRTLHILHRENVAQLYGEFYLSIYFYRVTAISAIGTIALSVMNYRARIRPWELIMATSWLLDAIWKTALCAAHKGNERRAPVKLPQRRQRVNAPSWNRNMQQISARDLPALSRISIDLQAIQFCRLAEKARNTIETGQKSGTPNATLILRYRRRGERNDIYL